MSTIPQFASNASNFNGYELLNLGTCPTLSLGGFKSYTIEAWVKLSNINGSQTIVSKFNGGVAAEYGFWIENGYPVSYRNVEPWAIKASKPIAANTWHRITTTYDGTSKILSLYVDGVEVASSPFTSQPDFPNVPTLIGALLDHGTPSSFFNGQMALVSICNECRTAAQIAG